MVYDISPTSTTQGQNAKFIAKCTIYTGSETQLVSPVIEAVVGVGNTAPYRGLAYIVMENDDLTDTQGAIAQYEFVVQKCGTLTTTVAPTPVAWWKLDETSGTVATDSSGNGYHGTYIGGAVHATAITANSTGSMQLTNSGMGVTVPYNAALNVGTLDTDWSICASFKPESTAVNGSFHTLIANFASENFGTTNFRLNLANQATIEPSFSFNNTLGTNIGVSSPTATTVNTSHRLWGVRSGTNMYIYMDGALVATSVGAGTNTSIDAFQGIHIGCGTLYPDSYSFTGRISDVAVYTRAVSAAQIAADAVKFTGL